MRVALLFAALVAAAPAATTHRVLQAVEFPYYLYPRAQWDRELVWLKSIGVRTVAFSVPWNWHEPQPGVKDFTGRTSPRRDLLGLLRLLRRLELRAWMRPWPPVPDWAHAGYPRGIAAERRAARRWVRELSSMLEPQTVAHGGPIAWAEGGFLDLPAPPAPITAVSATDPHVLAQTRQALAAARGSLLWQNVEDALWPAGWQMPGAPLLRRGAVSLSGAEQTATIPLRREAALLRHWADLFVAMRPLNKPAVKPVLGRFPPGVKATQVAGRQATALNIVNRSAKPYLGDIRVYDPVRRHTMVIPSVQVPAGEALWLPVHAALGGPLCRDCAGLGGVEHVVYATAELQAMEYENGILALEFAAPVAGEVVLQLARKPAGPFLAAGRLTNFDFDEKTLRARLPVPQGKGPGNKVRIGLAIEAPESSAFFTDAHRLIIGRKNTVETAYSSDKIAARSRLRLPEGFTARKVKETEGGMLHEIAVPADALHGDWANLAIEADGVLLGRARLQLFRPLSVRMEQALHLHFGDDPLTVEPPAASLDPKAGRNVDIVLRNNTPRIETFQLEASGAGLEFFPAKTEITIGAVMERTVSLRVFGEGSGMREWRLRIGGGATLDLPMRLVLVPRNQTVTWTADLDGDGSPEWVIENQRARAVFSAHDGRWLEFVWKDTGLNVLPENGLLAATGPVSVQAPGGARLEIATASATRTITLAGAEARLTIEQTTPLPAETLGDAVRDAVNLRVTRETPRRAVYTLAKAP